MRSRSYAPALVAISLMAACGGGGDKSAGTGGGTVIVAMPSDAGSLFPLLVADETGKAVSDLMFDHLAQIDSSMTTIGDAGFSPRLAKTWSWASDSMSIAFHLDPAARFHDGTPVTAADVRYSMKLAKDTTLGGSVTALIGNIDSVSVVDSLTPVVWFHKRSPEQFYDIAYQMPVIPEHIYGKVSAADLKTSDLTRQPVGSGRFRFSKWEPGVRVELLADTANYRGRPGLDRVVFMLAQAPTAAATAILTGQVDFYSAYPIDQAPGLDSNTVARRLPYSQNGYGFMGMNSHDPKAKTRPHAILSDVNVRRALSMSLDRSRMLQNVFNGDGTLADGPFPARTSLADASLHPAAYDTTAAKAMLDAAGWKVGANGVRMKNGKPLALELMVPTSSLIRLRYGDLIQEQLNRVGFQIEVAKIAPPQFSPRLAGGDYDLMILAVNTDPSVSGAKQFWSSTGGDNFTSYHSAAVDASLDSASAASNAATVRLHAKRAYQQIIDDAPAVWLYTAATVAGVNRRITIPSFPPDGWWGRLADWSIPADKRIDRDRIGLRPVTP